MTEPQNHTEKSCWFPARTHSGQEIKIKERLEKMGVECFIPTEVRRNYRGQKKLHPLITALVFIRATKQRACELKTLDQLPVNYLFDYSNRKMMIVPDKQMEDFQRVLDASIGEGGLMGRPVGIGDRVQVVRGPLKGVEGQVLELQGDLYVVVNLLGSIFAKVHVPRAYLETVAQ
jgi:transcription antitermination factor NusG